MILSILPKLFGFWTYLIEKASGFCHRKSNFCLLAKLLRFRTYLMKKAYDFCCKYTLNCLFAKTVQILNLFNKKALVFCDWKSFYSSLANYWTISFQRVLTSVTKKNIFNCSFAKQSRFWNQINKKSYWFWWLKKLFLFISKMEQILNLFIIKASGF